MGHQGGRRGERGSPMGMAYRHTTPEMQARVLAVIQERLAIALAVVLPNIPQRDEASMAKLVGIRGKGRLTWGFGRVELRGFEPLASCMP
jgi:hypothetical protein